MYYPLDLPGFEGRKLAVDARSIWRAARMTIDGKPAPKGEKIYSYRLTRNDSSETLALFRFPNPFDPIPQVVIDGQTILLDSPMKWHQIIWALLPLALVLIGGMIGGAVGAFTALLNVRLMRVTKGRMEKYLATGVSTLIAACVCVAVSLIFQNSHYLHTPAQEFRSEAGGFSVNTPVQLDETVYMDEAEDGNIEVHLFAGNKYGILYGVTYQDWPATRLQDKDPQVLMAELCNNFATNFEGELFGNREISLSGYPGRECVSSIASNANFKETMLYQAHMYLVGNRAYSISIIRPQTDADPLQIDEFITSFKLLNPL